jgi:hypothetical protein
VRQKFKVNEKIFPKRKISLYLSVWGSTAINIVTTTNIATVVAAAIRITQTKTERERERDGKIFFGCLPLSLSLSFVSVLLYRGKEMMKKLTV